MAKPSEDHHAHAHDAHAHDDFDPEPATTLAADEPRTPGWLPILGLVLFGVAGIGGLAMADASPKSVPTATPAAPMAPAAAAPAPQRAAPAATGTGPRTLRDISPEQMREVRAKMMEMKAKEGTQPSPSRPLPAPTATPKP